MNRIFQDAYIFNGYLRVALAVILSVISCCAVSSAAELSVIRASELHELWRQRSRVTIVDVRSSREFKRGHIPGSINVPSMVCREKKLPPLGHVVVVGDGVDQGATHEAAALIDAKKGIQAQVLEGGYMAWKAMGYPTTEAFGVQEESPDQYITYKDLKRLASSGQDVVILDVRGALGRQRENRGAKAPYSQPVDIGVEFPGVPIKVMTMLGSPGGNGARTTMSSAPQVDLKARDGATLYVVIDSGQGEAKAIARRLKAMGVARYVILAGGEIAVARKGRAGTVKIRK